MEKVLPWNSVSAHPVCMISVHTQFKLFYERNDWLFRCHQNVRNRIINRLISYIQENIYAVHNSFVMIA